MISSMILYARALLVFHQFISANNGVGFMRHRGISGKLSNRFQFPVSFRSVAALEKMQLRPYGTSTETTRLHWKKCDTRIQAWCHLPKHPFKRLILFTIQYRIRIIIYILYFINTRIIIFILKLYKYQKVNIFYKYQNYYIYTKII